MNVQPYIQCYFSLPSHQRPLFLTHVYRDVLGGSTPRKEIKKFFQQHMSQTEPIYMTIRDEEKETTFKSYDTKDCIDNFVAMAILFVLIIWIFLFDYPQKQDQGIFSQQKPPTYHVNAIGRIITLHNPQ